MYEILKSIFLGIIQGITEWLPISSTGHMILFNSKFPLDESLYSGGKEFVELFMTVIQFASIMAVIFIFFNRLNLFSKDKSYAAKKSCSELWKKIFFGSIPAAFVGFVFKDYIHKYFYNGFVVSFALVFYGILFLLVEKKYNKHFRILKMDELSYGTAFLIGIFQTLALIPGTSRSGSTILGALIVGCSRSVGAEFSFFLAIPTMMGASCLEIISYFKHNGFGFSEIELAVLAIGFAVSFLVSIIAISIFIRYVKKYNFNIFAYYRIFVGTVFFINFIFKKNMMNI